MGIAKFNFCHGDKAKDVITGKKGIITGNAYYITGCKQVLLSPQNGGDAKWFDECRIMLLKKNVIVLEELSNISECHVPPHIHRQSRRDHTKCEKCGNNI